MFAERVRARCASGRRSASGQCLKHHIQLLTCKRVLPCESMGVAGEARARVLRACRVRGGRVCWCASAEQARGRGGGEGRGRGEPGARAGTFVEDKSVGTKVSGRKCPERLRTLIQSGLIFFYTDFKMSKFPARRVDRLRTSVDTHVQHSSRRVRRRRRRAAARARRRAHDKVRTPSAANNASSPPSLATQTQTGKRPTCSRFCARRG